MSQVNPKVEVGLRQERGTEKERNIVLGSGKKPGGRKKGLVMEEWTEVSC